MVVRKYRLPVASVALLALLLQVFHGTAVALLAWVITALLLWLFRDPPLRARSHPMALVSPVRGTVRLTEEVWTDVAAFESGNRTEISVCEHGDAPPQCTLGLIEAADSTETGRDARATSLRPSAARRSSAAKAASSGKKSRTSRARATALAG